MDTLRLRLRRYDVRAKENEERNAGDIERQLDRIEYIVPIHVVFPVEM